ncbi:MAG: hypothetical protein KBD24_03705 [Candidatus Pacebacteria bacterium]|nr:hypothetical protein [Candidatus Paceibacterota bacterium]
MEKTDKQEILEAFAKHTASVDERIDTNKREILEAFTTHVTSVDERIDTNKREILEAFTKLTAHVEDRMDSIEERMGGLAQEMRAGFESIDRRLVALEETVGAMSTTLDSLLEGDVLGKEHITLTRPEYDTIVTSLHLPNRFAEVR